MMICRAALTEHQNPTKKSGDKDEMAQMVGRKHSFKTVLR